MRKVEQGKISGSYGKLIDVDGEKMNVDIKGKGEKVVVLLTGYRAISPALDMNQLSKKLASDHTVVTIKYFGYGLSNITEKAKTNENFAHEIHTVLKSLGYSKYTLMAHSISGIYGLYCIPKP